MATLNEIAETLSERAGRQFSQPFNMEMKALVNVKRSKLVRNTLERNRHDRIFFRQWCDVPLQLSNMSTIPGFPAMPVLVSSFIPNPLRANGMVFDFVGSPDKMSQFKVFTEMHEIIPALDAKYTGKKPKVLWYNNKLYIFNNLNLPKVSVAAIYDDVYALYNAGLITTAVTDNMEYPTPRDVQAAIIADILATELKVPSKPEDKLVNVDEPEKTEESYGR